MTEFLWSVNSNWKSERFEGCLAPFAAEAGRCDEVFCCRLALLRLRGLQVVGVRGARSRPLGPDAEHLAFYTVWGDYDFRKESFYVYGVLWCGWSVGSFMVVDHEYFDINACLNSQGEFLDMTGRAGVLLNVEVPAVGGLRRVRPQVAWFLQTATFGRSLSGLGCAAISSKREPFLPGGVSRRERRLGGAAGR